jgi:hypothetical protein
MSSDNITYSFCIENLRYIYKMIGYENIQKELEFIHHLHKSQTISQNISQSIPQISTEGSEKENIKDNEEIQENEETTKNIVVQDSSSIKYFRTEIPDSIRCEAIKNDGSRCSLKKDTQNIKDTKFCSRHNTKFSK